MILLILLMVVMVVLFVLVVRLLWLKLVSVSRRMGVVNFMLGYF